MSLVIEDLGWPRCRSYTCYGFGKYHFQTRGSADTEKLPSNGIPFVLVSFNLQVLRPLKTDYQRVTSLPTLGIPFLSIRDSSDVPDAYPSRDKDIQALCDEFIIFIEKIHQPEPNLLSPHQVFSSIFKTEALAHTLLSSKQNPRLGYDDENYRIEENWRLATLLHMHCTYLDCLDSPGELTEHAMRYERKIRDYQGIWEGSAEMLHAIFVKDEVEVGLENPERSWKVSRLLSTTERLSPSSNEIIRYLLAGSLSGECSTSHWESLWDADRIRTELLQDCSQPAC
jgi:hypothetical protein